MKFSRRHSLAILALLVACATNPATGKRQINLMSEAQEISAGQEADAQVKKEMGIYNDPNLQAYVSGIGMRLAKLSERPTFRGTTPSSIRPVVNAFALPGGYIYITRGILPFLNDEAQLAGVLGHEIGHVTARHAAQQYTRCGRRRRSASSRSASSCPGARPFGQIAEQALGVLFLKYSRDVRAAGRSARREVRVARRTGIRPASPTCSRRSDGSTRRRGRRKAFRTGSRRIPSRSRASRRSSRQVQQLSAGRTDFVRNQRRDAARRRRPDLRRQP